MGKIKRDEMRLIFLTCCSILLLFGCGSDETSEPIAATPNYFPDAVGSRWVYLGSEGTQSTLEVSGKTDIDGKNYRTFKHTPPPPDEASFNLLLPISCRVTENAVFFTVREKIDGYVQNELPASVQDAFAGLELTVAVDSISHPELTFFHVPLTLNAQWEALNLQISGTIVLQNLALLQIPFEILVRVTGEVVAERRLETPAESFEKAYQIEYQTELTQTLFSESEKKIAQHHTIWFVPHVGIVKTESEGGETEQLVEYTVK